MRSVIARNCRRIFLLTDRRLPLIVVAAGLHDRAFIRSKENSRRFSIALKRIRSEGQKTIYRDSTSPTKLKLIRADLR